MAQPVRIPWLAHAETVRLRSQVSQNTLQEPPLPPLSHFYSLIQPCRLAGWLHPLCHGRVISSPQPSHWASIAHSGRMRWWGWLTRCVRRLVRVRIVSLQRSRITCQRLQDVELRRHATVTAVYSVPIAMRVPDMLFSAFMCVCCWPSILEMKSILILLDWGKQNLTFTTALPHYRQPQPLHQTDLQTTLTRGMTCSRHRPIGSDLQILPDQLWFRGCRTTSTQHQTPH